MTIREAQNLLAGIPAASQQPQQWMDLGCGSGTFSLALAGLLPYGSHLLAIDHKPQPLPKESANGVQITFQLADIMDVANYGRNVDGIMMANSLHYILEKRKLLSELEKLMLSNVQFLLIEYDTDHANPWVPYPIKFNQLNQLFPKNNLVIKKLGERPSIYGHNKIYAAHISYKSVMTGP